MVNHHQLDHHLGSKSSGCIWNYQTSWGCQASFDCDRVRVHHTPTKVRVVQKTQKSLESFVVFFSQNWDLVLETNSKFAPEKGWLEVRIV